MNNSNWSWGPGLDKIMKKFKSLKLIINNNLHDYDQRRSNKKESRKN